MPDESQSSTVRYALEGLLAFGALNAFAGGYNGLSGAQGVPTEWLQGSPFSDYYIPSLILIVVVGGTLFLGALAVFVRFRITRVAAFGAGTVVLVWLVVQVAIIGYVSWMQPTTAVGGLLNRCVPTGSAVTKSLKRARLESDFGDAHQATPKHLVAQSIQQLDALKCFSM
jgi:hypothetical protein